jgi:hypothetical protein
MKACKAQSMSDAPNPPKEVGDVEKTASGQMSFWPDTPEESSDNPEKTTSSNSSIDAIEDASCMLLSLPKTRSGFKKIVNNVRLTVNTQPCC